MNKDTSDNEKAKKVDDFTEVMFSKLSSQTSGFKFRFRKLRN